MHTKLQIEKHSMAVVAENWEHPDNNDANPWVYIMDADFEVCLNYLESGEKMSSMSREEMLMFIAFVAEAEGELT